MQCEALLWPSAFGVRLGKALLVSKAWCMRLCKYLQGSDKALIVSEASSIQFNSTDPTGKPDRAANWGAKACGVRL